MAIFRTKNSNSVSSTNLKRLTTWFHEWLQKLQQQQQQTGENCENLSNKIKYSIFIEDKNEQIKSFKRKLRKLFKEYKQKKKLSQVSGGVETPNEKYHQVIPEFFSSTLLSQNINPNPNTIPSSSVILNDDINNMTIAEISYLAIREEYPDIDAEIRAILTVNAQNGVTISQIKDEYRKQTGYKFPLYDNITDFLLTIPYVTAECNENGTRIFNIKPMNKSRHLHEMIVNQKRSCDYNNNKTDQINLIEYRISHEHPTQQQQWRSNNYKRHCRIPGVLRPLADITENSNDLNNCNTNNNFIQNNNNKNINNNLNTLKNNNLNGALTVALETVSENPILPQPQPQQLQQLQPQGHQRKPQQASNIYYQDNCNHLNTRFNAPAKTAFKTHEIFIDLRKQQKRQQLIANGQFYQHPYHQRRYSNTPLPSCSSPTNTRSSQTNDESLYSGISDAYNAHILDFPLLGDDFFLYMARMELKCKFKKFEKILQSGFCVSGQTIAEAIRRLSLADLPYNTTIIVNIGSVDIMHGRSLVQIEHDFRQLLNLMHYQYLVPILTTLAPLANYAHDTKMKEKLLRFNEFIKREGKFLKVIDIHECLVNEFGALRFDCYQSEARSVTGAAEPYVFWNKIGRQRVLQMIEADLEY